MTYNNIENAKVNINGTDLVKQDIVLLGTAVANYINSTEKSIDQAKVSRMPVSRLKLRLIRLNEIAKLITETETE